ncbi:MAG: tRNA dihydrouridine synthase DusB [Proteobacteria bacterium]|nr:tRNA dihydrouridine synthase DusB [Pseudomonadota bacterium]
MNGLAFEIGGVRLENPLVMAPMAGITDRPFRLLVKEQGAALTVTEMVSAAGLCQNGAKTLKLLATGPWERPRAVQIFGANPAWMCEAAARVEAMGADIVDVNMGCPARKVVRHGSGAALLKDFSLIRDILTRVRKAIRVPLTVKTRCGWSPGRGDVLDLLPLLADCGVDALTIHGRYANQGFGGRADWDIISRVVENFPGPVIGNGDVTRPEHVLTLQKSTGCAGVMIGRGALGNPWIFSQSLALLQGRSFDSPGPADRLAVAKAHAGMMGEKVGRDRAVYMLRSVLMWYTKGLPGAAAFRGSINQTRDFDELMVMIDRYFDGLSAGEFPEAAAL